MAIQLKRVQQDTRLRSPELSQMPSGLESAMIQTAGAEDRAAAELFSSLGESANVAFQEYTDRRDEGELIRLNRENANAQQTYLSAIENETNADVIQRLQENYIGERRQSFETSKLSKGSRRKVNPTFEKGLNDTNVLTLKRITDISREESDRQFVDLAASAELNNLTTDPRSQKAEAFTSAIEQYNYAQDQRVKNGTIDYGTAAKLKVGFKQSEDLRLFKLEKERLEQEELQKMEIYRTDAARDVQGTLNNIAVQRKNQAYLAKIIPSLEKDYGAEWKSKAPSDVVKRVNLAEDSIKFNLTSKDLKEFETFVKGMQTQERNNFVDNFYNTNSDYNAKVPDGKLKDLQSALDKGTINGTTFKTLKNDLLNPPNIEQATPRMVSDFVSLHGQITAAKGNPNLIADVRTKLLTTPMPKSLKDTLVRVSDQALLDGPSVGGKTGIGYASDRISSFISVNASTIGEDFKPRLLGSMGLQEFTPEAQKDVVNQVEAEMITYINNWYSGERAAGRTPTPKEIDSKLFEFMNINYINSNIELVNATDGMVDIDLNFGLEDAEVTPALTVPQTMTEINEVFDRLEAK